MYLLAFSICFALVISASFLYRYGNIPRQHPIVTISVLIAYSFSFLIVFIIPLDITAVSRNFLLHQRKREKKDYSSKIHNYIHVLLTFPDGLPAMLERAQH